MTGDELFTQQLPRAAKECKPYLLRQHPQLASVDVSSLDAWLEAQELSEANRLLKEAKANWDKCATFYHANGRRDNAEASALLQEACDNQDMARDRAQMVSSRLVGLWLEAQIKIFGDAFEVEPIPMDDHARRDPVEELVGMVGPDRVIVVGGE